MTDLYYNVSHYSNTSLIDALKLPISIANGFLESSTFDMMTKKEENKYKLFIAIIERLNSVISGLFSIAKR